MLSYVTRSSGHSVDSPVKATHLLGGIATITDKGNTPHHARCHQSPATRIGIARFSSQSTLGSLALPLHPHCR